MGANLKEVRERISSVINTQKTTHAMKLVAASKLRRAQMAITQLRPYSNKLDHILENILSNTDPDANLNYSEWREPENIVIVLMTSDRGLAGAFNSNLIKKAVSLLEGKYKKQADEGTVDIVAIGKKGADYIRKHYPELNLIDDYEGLFHEVKYQDINQLSQFLIDQFLNKEVDRIEVVYSYFRNAVMQEAVTERFLPVIEYADLTNYQREHSFLADYIFEPDKNKVLEELIPTILHTKFQKFILDTNASEHGARMTAMDQATENANELLHELRISFNKARQEAITNEISEIVGGVAALQG